MTYPDGTMSILALDVSIYIDVCGGASSGTLLCNYLCCCWGFVQLALVFVNSGGSPNNAADVSA